MDEVILGQCRQTSDEPNIARVAALKVGIPAEVPAYTVMRQCASGMTAVQNGAMEIMTGQSDVVLAGGTESMSNAVFYVRDARWGVGTGNEHHPRPPGLPQDLCRLPCGEKGTLTTPIRR